MDGSREDARRFDHSHTGTMFFVFPVTKVIGRWGVCSLAVEENSATAQPLLGRSDVILITHGDNTTVHHV